MNINELAKKAREFRGLVAKAKEKPPPTGRWYDYDTLANVDHLARLLQNYPDELDGALTIADVGCGDGDLGLFLASVGHRVDLYDHERTNVNGFTGALALRQSLNLRAKTFDVNLDKEPLALHDYDLILFLGALYHLSNPVQAMRNLRDSAKKMILSTRTITTHPPIAYLLGPDELNHDPTNWWLFSLPALRVLAERTGWSIANYEVVDAPIGDLNDDQRTFMLLERD